MQYFKHNPQRAILVPKHGGPVLVLEDDPSWVPVAWQGGASFVVAAWNDALTDAFHFAFRADCFGRWSLWASNACRPSIKVSELRVVRGLSVLIPLVHR